MALHDLYESLEDHLDAAFTDPETAEASGLFTIADLDRADWAVRRIARARRRLTEAEQVAAAEIDRVSAWLDDQRRRCEADTAFLATLLEGFHRRVLDDDPKAKTLRLPAGELVARKTPDRFAATDEFVAWAKANGRVDLVRVTESADLTAAKRVLGINAEDPDENGHVRAINPETGEPVPGCWWQPGDVTFTVRTSEDIAPSTSGAITGEVAA